VRGAQGDEFVFVVGRENRLERRAIKLGPGGDDPAEVVAGLSAGERVLLEGPPDLAAGVEVAERPQDK
jgi:multidrug efflux system membrane fusion protein